MNESVLEQLISFARGRLPAREFEAWLYGSPEAEALIPGPIYLQLLSADYARRPEVLSARAAAAAAADAIAPDEWISATGAVLDELRTALVGAFQNEPAIPKVVAACGCEECVWEVAGLAGKHWTEVSTSAIRPARFTPLVPTAWRSVLPARLAVVLENWGWTEEVEDFAILLHDPELPQILSCLDAAQCAVLWRVIEFMAIDPGVRSTAAEQAFQVVSDLDSLTREIS